MYPVLTNSPATRPRKWSTPPGSQQASSLPWAFNPFLAASLHRQEEDAHQPLAVISYALWLNRYHRDPNIVGASIVLNRKAYSIVGVMPRSFEFPLLEGRLDQAQLWVPMSLGPDELSDDAAGNWGYQMVARLKDGVSLSQATQDVDRVAQQIMRDFPAGISAIHIRGEVTPLREHIVAECSALAAHPFSRRFHCAPDCLRQCRRSATGPGHPPPPRICGSPGAWRAIQCDPR